LPVVPIRRPLLALAALAGALLAGPPWRRPTSTRSTCSTRPRSIGGEGRSWTSVETAQPLTSTVWYVAEVSGTVSYWSYRMWSTPFAPYDAICGTPESGPMYHSRKANVPYAKQGGAYFATSNG
jgi:hypothetical protein